MLLKVCEWTTDIAPRAVFLSPALPFFFFRSTCVVYVMGCQVCLSVCLSDVLLLSLVSHSRGLHLACI